MKKFSYVVLCGLFLAITPMTFSNLLITEYHYDPGLGSVPSEMTFFLCCGGTRPEDAWQNKISWVVNTTEDIGQTYHITADMDPDFATIASLLTNGIPNGFEIGFGSSWLGLDTIMLGDGTTDLAGNVIDSISFTLNDITYNQSRDMYTLDTTYAFWTVPEPATLALLALGGFAIRKRR